ncbi:hypothetical protein L208DRAFT_146329 [Tricholoma matsutake]|nr:hypothetical protein L208DRAFT_146329 [Tricholoma matsutake 945]
MYNAPSDLSGLGGHRGHIRATPARYDCVFIDKDPELPGFHGLHVAQVPSETLPLIQVPRCYVFLCGCNGLLHMVTHLVKTLECGMPDCGAGADV